jgi:uncharacterized membrane protein
MTGDLFPNTYYSCFNSPYICVLFYIPTYIFNENMAYAYLTNINDNHKKVVHMHYKYRQ